MPRKAKDKIEETENKTASKSKSTKTTKVTKATKATKTTKTAKTTKSDKTTPKTETTKTTKSKKVDSAKTTKSNKTKTETAKKTSSTKKNTTRKTSTKKAEKKSSPKRTSKSKKSVQIAEYYDLPFKYGDTIVRLLAQTPKTLFVYWEVSDNDIENFKKTYGEDFFKKTKPFLIVHNLTLNKISEIEINDFANCWYLNTEDSDCKFDIELARKFIDAPSDSKNKESEYLLIAKSNDLQSPNNHILFEKIQEFVVFRDSSNNNLIKENIKSFKFLKDIYKFYKDMYDEEILNNPSSQFKF